VLTEQYLSDEVKKNEMSRAWETGEVHTGFWWGDLRERDHLEDMGIGRSIILKWIV
jgi:hypothetical protein